MAKRARDAKTGRWVTIEEANKRPDTTIIERAKKPKPDPKPEPKKDDQEP